MCCWYLLIFTKLLIANANGQNHTMSDYADATSTKIKVADLADYVVTMTETDGFSQEFKVLLNIIFIMYSFNTHVWIIYLKMYRMGQKSKLLHFVHIFVKYWSIFTIFLPLDSGKNLLLSGMHTALIMSLHYLVKYKYSKTYNIYNWTEGLMVNFWSI